MTPDGLAAEPDHHALGRSRGGLTTKIHLAVDASFHVLADRAYSFRRIRQYLRRRQIPHTIPEKRDQAGRRFRNGWTGGRPPGFDRERYKARHKVACRIGLLEQARGIATRYEKLAVRYEATVHLALIRQAL
ncbi:hypothetical protein GCM10010398_64050 [Streptomyces fimbriatus]